MPISGLPPTLENVINTCLQDKLLSSWKVVGGNQKVIITMCFANNTASGKTSPNIPRNKYACQRWFEKCGKTPDICDDFEMLASDSISEKSLESDYNIMNNSFMDGHGESTDIFKNHEMNDIGPPSTPKKHNSMHGQGKSLDTETRRLKFLDQKSPSIVSEHACSVDSAYIKSEKQNDIHELVPTPLIKDNIQALSQSNESLKYVESPKKSALSKFKDSIRGSRLALNKSPEDTLSDINKNDIGNVSPSKDVNVKLLNKIVKVMKRAATHCAVCNKVIKSSVKLKCTFCDVFLCSDCNYHNKHEPSHKKYISNFTYPHLASTDDFCTSCGYVTKVRHSFNTSFTCDLCPNYQLCQGCMSQGMHGHHSDHFKPYCL